MNLRTFASLAVSSALAVAPAATAFADTSPATQPASVTAPVAVGHDALSTTATTTSDAERYSQREAHDARTTKVADFAGGHRVYIIGGSALTLALIIVLIVLLV